MSENTAETALAEPNQAEVSTAAEPAPDIFSSIDTAPDAMKNPDTPADTKVDVQVQLDSEPNQDSAPTTETPVLQTESAPESSNPDIPQSADTAPDTHPISAPDASQDSVILNDTFGKPISEEKSEKGGGGGGGCSLSL